MRHLIFLLFLVVNTCAFAQSSVPTYKEVDNVQPEFFEPMTIHTTNGNELLGYGQFNFTGWGVYFSKKNDNDTAFEYEYYDIDTIEKIVMGNEEKTMVYPIIKGRPLVKLISQGKKVSLYTRMAERTKLGYILKKDNEDNFIAIKVNYNKIKQRVFKKIAKYLSDHKDLKDKIIAGDFESKISGVINIMKIYNSSSQ